MAVPRPALPPELGPIARTAPLVFFGIVRRRGESNVEGLGRTEAATAVVHIDEVIVAPPTLGDLTGHEITVRLAERAPPARRRVVFFASGLIYGAELAVAELGRVAPGRRGAELRADILGERLEQHDDRLRERLRLAEVVLYGRVASVTSLSPEAAGSEPPAGEAGPAWRVAELLPWRFVKGQASQPPRVLYPFPRTQRWPDVPLFLEGQEGVWLLQPAGRTEVHRPPEVADAFAALDPLDFHAPGALARIQLLQKTLDGS